MLLTSLGNLPLPWESGGVVVESRPDRSEGEVPGLDELPDESIGLLLLSCTVSG